MTSRQSRVGRAQAVEWPTIALILLCYGLWLVAGLFIWPVYPLIALGLLALTVALHSSLVHEVLHGHPTRNARINEGLVFLPIGIAWPYRRFKTLHLRHHHDERLTDPFDDPESYYQALWRHDAMPRVMQYLLRINNTMIGRLIFGPWLAFIGFFIGDVKAMLAGDRVIRKAWRLHVMGLIPLLATVRFSFGMPIWLYIVVPTWIGLSLISIRTFAEHQWSEHPEGRTVIVERSPLALLFLNNNLHFVHHKLPAVAWYQLPGLFRARRQEWLKENDGYAFPNYFAMLKAYAFHAKEPVVHPVLRRAPEPGRAFKPRIRAHSLNGLGSAPVPAEPPKE